MACPRSPKHATRASQAQIKQRVVHLAHRELLHLVVQVRNEFSPVFETDFENLAFLDLRDFDEVEVGVEEDFAVRVRFEELDM